MEPEEKIRSRAACVGLPQAELLSVDVDRVVIGPGPWTRSSSMPMVDPPVAHVALWGRQFVCGRGAVRVELQRDS